MCLSTHTIWRWQGSVWVVGCYSSCLHRLSSPSLSARPIHLQYKPQVPQCHHYLCMAPMSTSSQSSLCLQMPQNTNQSEFCNTHHIYLLTSLQVQDETLFSCLLFCAGFLWANTANFRAQPERWFAYGMPLALAHYFSVRHHVKFCPQGRALQPLLPVFVVNGDALSSQAITDVEVRTSKNENPPRAFVSFLIP